MTGVDKQRRTDNTTPLYSGKDVESKHAPVAEQESSSPFVPQISFIIEEQPKRVTPKPEELRIEGRTRLFDISIAKEINNKRLAPVKQGDESKMTPEEPGAEVDKHIKELVTNKIQAEFKEKTLKEREALVEAAFDFLDDTSKTCYPTTIQVSSISGKDSDYATEVIQNDKNVFSTHETLKEIREENPTVRKINGSLALEFNNVYKLASLNKPIQNPKQESNPDVTERITVVAQFDEQGNRKEDLVTKEYTAHTPEGLERLKKLQDCGLKLNLASLAYSEAIKKISLSEPEAREAYDDLLAHGEILINQFVRSCDYYADRIASLQMLKDSCKSQESKNKIEGLLRKDQEALKQLVKIANETFIRFSISNGAYSKIAKALPDGSPQPLGYRYTDTRSDNGPMVDEREMLLLSKGADYQKLIDKKEQIISIIEATQLEDSTYFLTAYEALKEQKDFFDGAVDIAKKYIKPNREESEIKQIMRNADGSERSFVDIVRAGTTSEAKSEGGISGQPRKNILDDIQTGLRQNTARSTQENILLALVDLAKSESDLQFEKKRINSFKLPAIENEEAFEFNLFAINPFAELRHHTEFNANQLVIFERIYNKPRTHFGTRPELGVLRTKLYEYYNNCFRWSDEERFRLIVEIRNHVHTNKSAQSFNDPQDKEKMALLVQKIEDEFNFVSAVLPTLPPSDNTELTNPSIEMPDVRRWTRFVSHIKTNPVTSGIIIFILFIALVTALIFFAWPAIAPGVGATVGNWVTTAVSATVFNMSAFALGYIIAGAALLVTAIVQYVTNIKMTVATKNINFDETKEQPIATVKSAITLWSNDKFMPKHAKAQLLVNAFKKSKSKQQDEKMNLPGENAGLDLIFSDSNQNANNTKIRDYIFQTPELYNQIKDIHGIEDIYIRLYTATPVTPETPETPETRRRILPKPSESIDTSSLQQQGFLSGGNRRHGTLTKEEEEADLQSESSNNEEHSNPHYRK